jgi:hypothetical protein
MEWRPAMNEKKTSAQTNATTITVFSFCNLSIIVFLSPAIFDDV